MELSILIVTHNTKKLLKNCIESIYDKTYGLSFEIIVIDNGSQDNTVDMLREEYPQITIIRNEKSIGFGRGNNQGFKIAKGDFILILEPDTLLNTKDGLKKMIRYLKSHSDVGALAPQLILVKNGKVQKSAFIRFPNLLTFFCEWTPINQIISKVAVNFDYPGKYYYNDRQLFFTREIAWAMGGILMVNKKVILKVGGFDPKIFLLTEDTDLCRKIRNQGYKIVYFVNTKISHYWGANQSNIKSTISWYFDGMSYYLTKYHQKYYLYLFYLITYFTSFISIFCFFLLSRFFRSRKKELMNQVNWHFQWIMLLNSKSKVLS